MRASLQQNRRAVHCIIINVDYITGLLGYEDFDRAVGEETCPYYSARNSGELTFLNFQAFPTFSSSADVLMVEPDFKWQLRLSRRNWKWYKKVLINRELTR
ncbi:hypothetical protein EYC84_006492 [Monilinia fructicola]|uniref:Uncharacterized protein n=1 Tax=Monilinia fructicola TaxID=38448 RepID=A0A5M9K622_MONFR|nr:hypothetical protein EYC84_006492 [Monilinia fructicola]